MISSCGYPRGTDPPPPAVPRWGNSGTGVGPLQQGGAPDGISKFPLCAVSEQERVRRERELGTDRVRERVAA